MVSCTYNPLRERRRQTEIPAGYWLASRAYCVSFRLSSSLHMHPCPCIHMYLPVYTRTYMHTRAPTCTCTNTHAHMCRNELAKNLSLQIQEERILAPAQAGHWGLSPPELPSVLPGNIMWQPIKASAEGCALPL